MADDPVSFRDDERCRSTILPIPVGSPFLSKEPSRDGDVVSGSQMEWRVLPRTTVAIASSPRCRAKVIPSILRETAELAMMRVHVWHMALDSNPGWSGVGIPRTTSLTRDCRS